MYFRNIKIKIFFIKLFKLVCNLVFPKLFEIKFCLFCEVIKLKKKVDISKMPLFMVLLRNMKAKF